MNLLLKNTQNRPLGLEDTIKLGVEKLISIQNSDGSWSGEYGGSIFLIPMNIIMTYITGQKIDDQVSKGFITYLFNEQSSEGGIGLHEEDRGSMFVTVLSYVALRILGVDRKDFAMCKMRKWIRSNGTALGSATWGKFFLALMNLYPYKAVIPVLPELWSLPDFLPVHPGKLWCHARQVYLPMAYLYGIKAVKEENDLIVELRNDLYTEAYEEIDFVIKANVIADTDNYVPYSNLLKIVNKIQFFYERIHSKKIRKKSLENVFEHILHEDKNTNYINIGPVNKILNTLVHYYVDKDGEHFQKSYEASKLYIHKKFNGYVVNGYNSTALWDTAFSVKTLVVNGEYENVNHALRNAYDYLKNNQILEDVPQKEKYYRHASKGGWPFSNRPHGWPITDCSAEGFLAASVIENTIDIAEPISSDLMEDCIKLILSYQNDDGGWSSYERRRGGFWLEHLNPSNVFKDIMIDYSYVECSSACIQALSRARFKIGEKFHSQINKSIKKGIKFLKSMQKSDGSFEGSWAVCFTYGTWFGVWGLLAGGLTEDSPEIIKAANFLMRHQNSDGGWGEDYRACNEGKWINMDSHVVNTSWALMTLVKSGMHSFPAAHRAAQYLIDKQMLNGEWPHQSIVGVYNKTTLINYDNYRKYFPIWALGLYKQYNNF